MSNDATHINICNLMGITYIVYCSGHFSKKTAKIFLRFRAVIPSLGPKKTTIIMTCIIIRRATNFETISTVRLLAYCNIHVPDTGVNATSFGHQLGQLSLV